ncbi:MAG: flagellar biosynthetic protein FliQ, partial [Candidatus Hydrogenedentes bacterium]|nr:flagellar biosynthetic protein FliQ [Candidatus Hydrogenedentota bacterium]
PMLIGVLIVGLTISVFQSVTQLQEQTLVFVPKILAVFVLALVFMPFMLNQLLDFIRGVLTNIPNITP